MSRKKQLAPAPVPAREHPRALAPKVQTATGYPRVSDALAIPGLRAKVEAALRMVAWGGAAALAASGCAQPTCGSSSFDEATSHSETALRAIVDLRPLDAANELAVGLGVMAHPAPLAMPGGIMSVTTVPPVPVPPTEPTTNPNGKDPDAGIMPSFDTIPLGGAVAPVMPDVPPHPATTSDPPAPGK